MKYLSVCSGIEAATVAWHHLGWKPVGFAEIEKFPQQVLAHHYPDVPNFQDLTQHDKWPLERGAVDLLVGGTPCQAFSIAGLRRGMDDERGQLTLEFVRLAARLRPRWIVWENVPGVLSSGGGRDFGSFLGALAQLGYGFAYRVLDAQHFGVPQRRRRVFVVACLGDWRAAAEVLSLREGLRGYLETGNKKRKGPAADVGASVEASGLHRTVGTLCADTHPGAYSGQDAYTGRLIPVSHWEGGDIHPTLNQAHNIGSPGYSNQELFSQKGAGLVPTPFRKSKRACSTTDNETWVPADASNTLNNFDLGDTRTTHAVVQPVGFSMREDATNGTFDVKQVDTSLCLQALRPAVTSHHAQNIVVQPIAWTQNQREEVRLLGDKVGAIALPGTHQTNYIAEPVHQMPGSVAPTIGASGPPYSRTGNERVEAEALAVTFQPGNLRREAGADPSFTTTTTLKASAGDQTPHVATPMAVRRLTPVECERLQGFPDNWSRIPWKGKPETECPDGPRYKACGNSMAVPVMRWIGERIAAVDCTLSPHA